MSLQGVPFWGSPLNAQLAPTSGHACLMRGIVVTFDIRAHSGTASLLALIRSFGIGTELAFSLIERGGSHWAETDSAANQFGAPDSAKDPRGTLPF